MLTPASLVLYILLQDLFRSQLQGTAGTQVANIFHDVKFYPVR